MVTSSHCQHFKANVKNLSGGNSNLALKYFDIAVIWDCTTCGISQACTASTTTQLWLNGNLALL